METNVWKGEIKQGLSIRPRKRISQSAEIEDDCPLLIEGNKGKTGVMDVLPVPNEYETNRREQSGIKLRLIIFDLKRIANIIVVECSCGTLLSAVMRDA